MRNLVFAMLGFLATSSLVAAADSSLPGKEQLLRRALADDEKRYGPEHPSVAGDLNDLAMLIQDTGRLAEAEPLMRRALAIDEKSFGPEHPKVAIYLNNLAALLHFTNRQAEAEPLMRRALVIDEKRYGPEHPKRRHQAQQPGPSAPGDEPPGRGRAADATRPCHRRRAIGPDHPNVAVTSTTWRCCSRTRTVWPRPSR